MLGPSGDEGGDAGTLPAPACPRHRGHFGGGKPPPPTVLPMRHAGPPAGPERQASYHRPVYKGRLVEEAAACRGGDEGVLREVLQGIRGAA